MHSQGHHVLLTATHSIMSTYLGSITIVLKLPFTRAASANGLDRYSGFAAAPPGDGGSIEPEESVRFMGAGERPERGARLRLNGWHLWWTKKFCWMAQSTNPKNDMGRWNQMYYYTAQTGDRTTEGEIGREAGCVDLEAWSLSCC